MRWGTGGRDRFQNEFLEGKGKGREAEEGEENALLGEESIFRQGKIVILLGRQVWRMAVGSRSHSLTA